MSQWLLQRLFDSKDQPKPRFAFQGTVNWMRALSVLVQREPFSPRGLADYYRPVKRRKVNRDADTFALENMMMAFHSQASLLRLKEDSEHPYDVCRSAIVDWYYSTYFTCSAMVAAASGSKQTNHTQTARVWQNDIVEAGLLLAPFSLHLSSMVKAQATKELEEYRRGNKYDLNIYAETEEEAWGAVISYLSGTWDFYQWQVEEKVKGTPEFKQLDVDNFRKKAARQLRDKELQKRAVNYLDEAFRYRGKANYRDSIFLTYGYDYSPKIERFIDDMEVVSRAFQRMAAHYLERRLEKGVWSEFVSDLKDNSRLSIDPNYLAVNL